MRRLQTGIAALDTTIDYTRRHLVNRQAIIRLGMYLLLFDVAYVFLFPFSYMLITSLKSPTDLADFSVNWVPRTLYFRNYLIAGRAIDYFRYFRNSVFVTSLSVAGHLLSCSFIAYGLARYTFRGKKLLFGLVILSVIIPIQTLIVPQFMTFSNLGMNNSYAPLIIPTFFGFGLKGGLYIFILRQFFLRLPYELEDAAKIDGAGFLRIYWGIVMPVSQPALLVSGILGMVWHWNDYYEPSIYITKLELRTLPSALPGLFRMIRAMQMDVERMFDLAEQEMIYNDATVMAATTLVILPIIVVFLVVQRYFIQSVERTGIVE